LPERLEALADQVRRLVPDWNRPERFYERRSGLAGELRQLAAEGHAQRGAVRAELDDGARPRSGRVRP
jgi:hypothetical protein